MATTNFSQLLGLALPTTGDLSGVWGEEINNSITNLIDSAIAGTTTLTTDANVTLTTTNGAANQARNAIILCTGARTVQRTITAPAQSKAYIVINNTTGSQSVKLVGAGPTTGVVIEAGTEALVAWDGSDFVKVASLPLPGTVGNVLTSTGTDWVSSPPSVAVGPFLYNTVVVASNVTFPTGQNAISVGPVTINSGVTVTVPSGQRWVVV